VLLRRGRLARQEDLAAFTTTDRHTRIRELLDNPQMS
jgi:hypothetical protein